MVELAIKEFLPPGFPIKVDPIEVEHGDSIPSVYLLDEFEAKYNTTHDFSFIMGSDLIKWLHKWDESERMINEKNCIIFLRKGFPNDGVVTHANFPKNRICISEEESLIGVISSTEIRNRVLQNIKSDHKKPFFGIAGLVCPSVIKYIEEHGLY